jgi:hypothetical protein
MKFKTIIEAQIEAHILTKMGFIILNEIMEQIFIRQQIKMDKKGIGINGK